MLRAVDQIERSAHIRSQDPRSVNLELDRHSDAPRRQPWRSWALERSQSGPIAVDLFAGGGV